MITAPRRLLVLSTCGTSLLTNDAPPEVRKWLTGIANAPTLDAQDAARLKGHTEERRRRLLGAGPAERSALSAELKGIAAACRKWPAQEVFHLLIHSDTEPGRAAAEVVAAVLRESGSLGTAHKGVVLLSAPGLRTDDPGAFREALAELTRRLEEVLPGFREKGYFIVFNLTGGFKSVNAYLQALGMLHADRCVFVFESAEELMEIPRLPVRLAEVDEVRAHLRVFRRLAAGYRVTTAEVAGIPDTLLLVDEGTAERSIWGDVVWERVKGDLLGEAVLDPLSPRLRLSEAVRRSAATLERKRKVALNEALDTLSAYLDGERPSLPKAHQLKGLKGDPLPPATHEYLLWSDGDARRLYGHFEEGIFVGDWLKEHL